MRRLTICLFGSFEVRIDDGVVTGFGYAKTRALLAYLALESQRPLARAYLATLLWPEQPEQMARASLSQALTTLRNALGEKTAAQPVLLADTQNVQLDLSGAVEVVVDVTKFLNALRAAEAHPHQSWRTCSACAKHLRQALELYQGDFLADLYIPDSDVFEEWAALQREHLRQRVLSTLERLVEWAEWRGAFGEALEYARRQVAIEPLMEANQRSLMRLFALNGELTAALLQFRHYCELLARELGEEPEEATRALFEQIRHGQIAGLQPPQPPFVVPTSPTKLVGREVEVHTLCSRVRESTVRALTITGTGGIGKTRLAVEAAHALRYNFEDGVYFVELAQLNDAALVADALAQALGSKVRPGQDINEVLCEHLHSRHLLLILDNFEHVVAAAPLVAKLLAACPRLTVLATSRTPLAIRAEEQLILEPLADAAAVELFVQRAQAAGANLSLSDDDSRVYAAICRRLDRLPLAIELIAVRARVLAPPELLRQIVQPLQALIRGSRDLPPRHQTLRSAIQWSYDLLEPDQRRVFRGLGVFAGGCSREAAQAVLGQQALLILETLQQASLVQQQTVAGEPRFLMLETIREFAQEQLTTQEERRLHAEFFLALLEQARPELSGEGRGQWTQRLKIEHPNLRAALQTVIAARDVNRALRLVAVLWHFWSDQGYLNEGRIWIDRTLALAEASADNSLSPADHEALLGAAFMAFVQDDYACARQRYQQLRARAERSGQQLYIAKALDGLGIVEQCIGSLREAHDLLEQSINASRAAGDLRSEHWTLLSLAFVHAQQGAIDAARPLFERAVAFNRSRADAFGLGNVLAYYAYAIAHQGSCGDAEPLAEEALAIALREDLPWTQQIALHALGLLAFQREAHADARSLFERALIQSHRLGDRLYLALAQSYLGLIDLREQDWEHARGRLLEALQLARAISSPKAIILALEGLAFLQIVWCEWERATQLFGAIERMYLQRGAIPSPLNYQLQLPYVRAAHANLEAQRFALAWARGQQLDLDAVCALASALSSAEPGDLLGHAVPVIGIRTPEP